MVTLAEFQQNSQEKSIWSDDFFIFLFWTQFYPSKMYMLKCKSQHDYLETVFKGAN